MVSHALLRDGLWTMGMYRVRGRLHADWMVDYRQRWNPAPTALANFRDNEGHVVGEGPVPPGSYTLEDCLLRVCEC